MFVKKAIILIIIFGFNYSTAYWDSNEKVFVRKSAKDMTPEEWRAFKHGFAVLRERGNQNASDPTGYQFQANIHGWSGINWENNAESIAEENNWHKGQHGQYFFLPWHRVYLYYFERILRSASGDPNLTIPYWDYYAEDQRSIPELFRIPADPDLNPLYIKNRCSEMNDGNALPSDIVDHRSALSSRFFSIDKSTNPLMTCYSFGGSAEGIAFKSNGEGVLEDIPHNQIHIFVGGFIANTYKSANDPLFWLLHAQVDRVWESWVRLNGKNPDDSRWLNQTFDWFDENRKRHTRTVADYLDTVNQMNYKYDTYIESNSLVRTASNPVVYRLSKPDANDMLIINENKPWIILPLNERSFSILDKFSRSSPDLSENEYTVEFSLSQMRNGVAFDMYLNLPNGTHPHEMNPYFIRSLAPKHYCEKADQEEKDFSVKYCYDVSRQLRQILDNELTLNGKISEFLNLTFVPKFHERDSADDEDWMKFSHIQFLYYLPNGMHEDLKP